MEDISLINNTSVYRNPAPQSPLQGPNVMQPAAVYSKILLRTIELAESDYVFDGLATERTMPSNNGSNEIVFKRMLALAAHTQPLAEGIPPASDQGRMVAIKASTKMYGRVMKFTDKVNWAVVDPLISEYTRQLALKVPETKDILAQEALLAECQTFYAQPKKVFANASDPDVLVIDKDALPVSHIKRLSPACNPTIDEFRKIVLSMEVAKVRPYSGGNFLGLISSAVMYDLVTDRRVKDFMKWTGNAKSYEQDVVIDLFSLVFKKAKTIKTDNTYIDAEGNVRYIYHTENGSVSTTADTNLSAAYSGALNVITYKPINEVAANDKYLVVYLDAAGEIELTNAAEAAAKLPITTVLGNDYDVLNVHHSFVIGEEALYRIGVQGHTNTQFIKKELGSAGTEDPLNQIQSIGWKIDSLGYKVVNPDAVVDYMSIPSQYKANVHARPDLKNEFTDYYYGYMGKAGTAYAGRYFHPDQVESHVAWDGTSNVVKYFVKGTTVEVDPVKMTKLVKPINGGRIDANGLKNVVKGDMPTLQFALKSNNAIRFAAGQVVQHTDNKFYIKGLAGTSSAEVVSIEPNGVVFSSTEIKASGDGTETRSALVEHGDVNKTGHPDIDGD